MTITSDFSIQFRGRSRKAAIAIRLSFALAALLITSVADATTSWTGAVSNLWSVGGNWDTGVAPSGGESLSFPDGASHTSMVNDLPAGLAVATLSFTGSNTAYSLAGNGIALAGGLSTNCCPAIVLSAPMTLTSSQTFNAFGVANFAGPIDLNGFTLTLVTYVTTLSGSLIGSGTFITSGPSLNLTGSSSFSGTITLGSPLNVAGTITNASLTTNRTLSGNGTIADATISNSGALAPGNDNVGGCCGDPHTTAILSTGNLSLLQGSEVRIDLINPTAGTGYDQINTTGTVTINSATLTVSLPSTVPAPGQSFAIINNDGTDPIIGTFNGLSEGTAFSSGPSQFRISYVGGTGNDVVLTALVTTATTLTSSKNPTVSGESFTLHAHVTSSSGTPQGQVAFFDGSTLLGMATVDANGDATLSVALLSGSHSLRAFFGGGGLFASNTSDVIVQTVNKAATALQLSATPNPAVDNQNINVTVHVSIVSPGSGTPAGVVTIAVDGQTRATVTADQNGHGSASIPPLSPGTHTITASYAGDAETLPSSTQQVQNVLARISIADAQTVKGSADTIIHLPVVLSAPSNETVTVNYASSDGTAIAGTDYVPVTGMLQFAPGVTSQTIDITIKANSSTTPSMTFTVSLSTPTNATLERGTATVTILNASAIPTLNETMLALLAIVFVAWGARLIAKS